MPNIQAYTSDERVVSAVKNAAKITGTSVAKFAGETLQEKVKSMGLLQGEAMPNLWGVISELVSKGVKIDEIIKTLEPLIEEEVFGE